MALSIQESDGRWLLLRDGERLSVHDDEMAAFTALRTAREPAVDPLTAGAYPAPVRPPAGWFADPQFDDSTTAEHPDYPGARGRSLTINDDGRVFGHLALWQVPHTGFGGERVYAPKSKTNYAKFREGHVVGDDGKQIATGPLTAGTGHASVDPRNPITAAQAAAHYDNTGIAVADVVAGEDGYGIWVAGSIRPGVTDEQVEGLRRSRGLSGDWRDYNGNLELIAALAVNVAGFPVPQYALAASGAGVWDGDRPLALVAAGAAPLLAMASEPWAQPMDELRRDNASLRETVTAMRDQLAVYLPVLRPMVASAQLARGRDAVTAAAKTSQPDGSNYADPGYQDDKVKRYPLDSASRVRSAWSFINQSSNASKYTAPQLATIKGRIKTAAKKFDVDITAG